METPIETPKPRAYKPTFKAIFNQTFITLTIPPFHPATPPYWTEPPFPDENHPAFHDWYGAARGRYVLQCRKAAMKYDTMERLEEECRWIANQTFDKWKYMRYCKKWKAPKPKKAKPKRSDEMRQYLLDNRIRIDEEGILLDYSAKVLPNGRIELTEPTGEVKRISAYQFVKEYA